MRIMWIAIELNHICVRYMLIVLFSSSEQCIADSPREWKHNKETKSSEADNASTTYDSHKNNSHTEETYGFRLSLMFLVAAAEERSDLTGHYGVPSVHPSVDTYKNFPISKLWSDFKNVKSNICFRTF